jgi:hypothetical protein
MDRQAPSLPAGQDDLAAMDTPADGDADRGQGHDGGESAAYCPFRAVEQDEEGIAGRPHLLTAEGHDDTADDVIVHVDGALPGCVAAPLHSARGIDDIGEEHRPDDPKAPGTGRHAETGTSRPVEHQELFVALDPDDMTRPNVEDVVRADHEMLPGIGTDAQASRQDDTPVVELT